MTKKKERDMSEPTAFDLSGPVEMKTLAWDTDTHEVVPVYSVPEPEPVAAPAPSFQLDQALALVDTLAAKCTSGWCPDLADIRELRAAIAKLA